MSYLENRINSVYENKNRYQEEKSYRAWGTREKNYYCGVYPIEYIYLNEWADPLLHCYGLTFNVYDLEDTLFSEYRETTNNEDCDAFSEWVRNNAAYVRDTARGVVDYLKDNIKKDVADYIQEVKGYTPDEKQIKYVFNKIVG